MDFELLQWEPSLAPSLAESANDARISRWLRDVFPYPYSRTAADMFIAFAEGESAKGDLYRAIAVGGKAVGGISVAHGQDVCRRSAEIGYWLNPAYWSKGIMTEAVRRICGMAFAETDVCRIYAEVFAPNAASCRVLEKCGFALEGTLRKNVYKRGEFFDSYMYALLKE